MVFKYSIIVRLATYKKDLNKLEQKIIRELANSTKNARSKNNSPDNEFYLFKIKIKKNLGLISYQLSIKSYNKLKKKRCDVLFKFINMLFDKISETISEKMNVR